jgi:hypothetical protein
MIRQEPHRGSGPMPKVYSNQPFRQQAKSFAILTAIDADGPESHL